jgi:cell wall-associated NlpC family hydrolase
MKSLVILGAAAIATATLSGAAAVTGITANPEPLSYVGPEGFFSQPPELTMLEQDHSLAQSKIEASTASASREELVARQYEEQLYTNQKILEETLVEVISRAGVTPYVFSGSSPLGWDCSGLVVWAYGQMEIDLPHSASQQDNYGIEVSEPRAGDVVLFGDSSGIFHSAIYVGDGKVVHAGFKPGTRTEIISLDSPSFAGTEITFRRLLELP